MPFYIGKFAKPIDLSHIIHIKDPNQTETLKTGDIVERWDHIFEWDTHCLKSSELEAWRAIGDPLCDAAIKSMFAGGSSNTGVDLLERLQSDAASNPHGPAQALLENASRFPPDDIAATDSEICEAHAFFLQHSVVIMQSLLSFSLAGGFASPRITRVLESISYLVPPKKHVNASQIAEITPEMNDRTYSRLLETFQFVLDVMGCTTATLSSASADQETRKPVNCLRPGGEGWKAALRVRLLHGVARRRILQRVSSPANAYSVEKDGIPINQEDMAATLGSFSAAPLWCLSRLYLLPIPPPTLSEASSFIATWRHIGFYLGVDQNILRNHFISPHTANNFLASTILHLLTSESFPPNTPRPRLPTIPILLASSDRPPFPKSFEHHCTLTRHLLGPSLATHLGVPAASRRAELNLIVNLCTAQIPVLFARVYPRRAWARKRAALTQEALARVVRFQMGMRRTTFRARTEQGELGENVLTAEAVKPDPEGGKRLVREYRALMLEMGCVVTGIAVLLIGGVMGCCGLYLGYV